MEQIIGIIVMVILGGFIDWLGKRDRARRINKMKDSASGADDRRRRPVAPVTDTPTPPAADTRRPSVPAVPPAIVPEAEPETEAIGAIPTVAEIEEEKEEQARRWRRAVIDSEILARRF